MVVKKEARYRVNLLERTLDLQEKLLKKVFEDNLFIKKFITKLKSLINEK